MKASVTIQPQATPLSVLVELNAVDVQPSLDAEWEKVAAEILPVQALVSGQRRKLSREEWEQVQLTKVYYSFWVDRLYANFHENSLQPIVLVQNLQVVKSPTTYQIQAVVWTEPVVKLADGVIDSFKKEFLVEEVTDEDVALVVENMRNKLRYESSNVKDVTLGRPLQEGDVVRCDATMGRQSGKMMIALSSKCDDYIKQALIGRTEGDEVKVVQSTKHPGMLLKITTAVEAPEITDAVLCESEGVPSMDSLRLNVRRGFELKRIEFLEERFLRWAAASLVIAPVPVPMIMDRVEGRWSFLLSQEKEPQLLQKLGVRSRDEAKNHLANLAVREYHQQLAAKALQAPLGLSDPNEDELALHARQLGCPLTSESRYVVYMDLLWTRFDHYLKTFGKDLYKPSLIIASEGIPLKIARQ